MSASRSQALAPGAPLRVAARILGWLTPALLALGCTRAHASNPRWVTGGQPYFTTGAVPIIWYTRTPLYYTDPGDLSAYVNHAAADAIVAAAANVWNVPTADFTIAQGGQLAEHVSGANSYLAYTGVVFPADVQPSNYTAIQIAVLYDTDGSVTDLLLGQGASAPVECLQNGVTESVDQISTAGRIQHAILVLNGRCTGPAPEQQLQLQYQLERAFGRIFGVGWSQTNDNVFTHVPSPTYAQALHWPIMHPIDIVCGPYTYQCLPQPFTLRDDDVAAISQLYLIGFDFEFWWTGYDQWLPGKTQTYDRAADLYGTINFPNGQGMAGVNVVGQRLYMFNPTPEPFYDVSSVSGFRYARTLGNPVTGPRATMTDSMGSPDGSMEGWFDLGWIPMIDSNQGWVDVLVTTEPVNPLYTGVHSVGPYVSGTVTPSGVTAQGRVDGIYPNDPGFNVMYLSLTPSGSAASCSPASTGTETAPAPVAPTGWWSDILCGPSYSAWFSQTIAPGHTATFEVTALDETGSPTENKMQPLIGLWNASDPTGTPPTYAAATGAFNSMAVGTTSLTVSGSAGNVGGSGEPGALRLAITDARGDGRPDFAYKARVLYASSVQPAATSLNGSPFTISGMGFRNGNEVLVNGVPATVATWSANSISAVAPPASAFSGTPAGPVDVSVYDLQTGATTTAYGALTYTTQPPDLLTLVSAPSGIIPVGAVAPQPFSVRVLLPDGVTPVPGVAVTISSAGPGVQVTGCSGNPCLAITDSTGLASVTVTPLAAGDVTLTASAVGAFQSTAFHAQSHGVATPLSTLYVAAGATVPWTISATLLQDGLAAGAVPVSWTSGAGLALTPLGALSSGSGLAMASATVGPLASGAQASGQVCGWPSSGLALTACAPLAAIGVDPATLAPVILSGAGQSIGSGRSFAPVVVQLTDPAGHPVAGGIATIYQAVDQAQMPCPAHGACPQPAQLASSVTTAVSDVSGHVTVVPLQVSGTPAVTQIAITTGSQGFVSLSLTQGQ